MVAEVVEPMKSSKFVWVGVDAPRAEIAHVVLENGSFRARGTQIGTEPEPYELRYEVESDRVALELVGGAQVELRLEGADFFDLPFSPLFNSFPIVRDGLHLGGAACDYVMRLVEVPELTAARSEQRYEPVRPGLVRFRSGSFVADLEVDADGFLVRYSGLAERVSS
jgi:hypothetical protein